MAGLVENIWATMLSIINQYSEYVNINDWELVVSIIMIVICPTTWNLIARWEFHTKIFSKMAGDNRLAADIFAHLLIEMGILRNYLFTRAVRHQPHFEVDESYEIWIWAAAWCLLICGMVLNVMVLYRLGIHGIYYADYFGILMKEMVTEFPYNVLDNPLYIGSTMMFLGTSMLYKSPSGLLMTVIAWAMYQFASVLENPMTTLIYSEENIKYVRKMSSERNKEISLEKRKKRNEIKSN